ncbi:MAG TPA: universal stress protein [Vicinamibacterales bacterium]|nr:universal stress protein [Vicinamibacterales bacterium]
MIALKKILVATDFGEPSEAALRYGIELTRRFDASLHVLHVVADLAVQANPLPGPAIDVGSLQTELEVSARATLDSLLPEPERSALRAHLEVTVSASPAETILAVARDLPADLIIVGTHGRRGFAHFLMGSVAQHVSRLANCPVLTVRVHERDFVQPDTTGFVEQSRMTHVRA